MKKADFSNITLRDPDNLDDLSDAGEPNFEDPETLEIFNKVYMQIVSHPETEDLSFAGNWISGKQFHKFAEAISVLKDLQVLKLRYNKISNSDVDHVKKIIREHPKLRAVYLDFNQLSDGFIIALIKGNNSELNERLKTVKFHLTHNQFTEEGFKQARAKLSNFSASSILAYNQISPALQSKYHKELLDEESQPSQPLILSKTPAFREKTLSDEKGTPEIKVSEIVKPK